jgi:hypothetical protein
MATARIAPTPALDEHVQPESFRDALKLGWQIVKEETVTDESEQTRTGVLLLAYKGSATKLRVSYTATRNGFTFSKPEPID